MVSPQFLSTPSSSFFYRKLAAQIFLPFSHAITTPFNNSSEMDSASDPILKHFPILCYVLSRLNSVSGKPHLQIPSEIQESVLTQLPHLNNPEVLGSMIQAIPSNVTQTWSSSLISLIGPRPDPSAVASARESIAEIQSGLLKNLQDIQTDDEAGGSVHQVERENKLRKSAEEARQIYAAVVRLEEMHQAYEKQLSDAQDHLVEVYEATAAELDKECDLELNEDVLSILKDPQSAVAEKIDLSGRRLRFLPEELGKLRRLLVLNLSQNQLEILPDAIAGLQKLECLDVSSNLLESLPDSIGLLLNLKILNVSGNKLNLLPETITGCSSLMELDAGFNDLLSLPINIGYGLANLEKLSIQLNKICYLPASICQLRSLRYLDAHFNKLHGLPSAIGRLTSLQVLILSGNFVNFTEVPESISDLCNLRELDLSNNQIRALPDRFGRLEKLSKVNLDQNPLVIPPMAVVKKGAKSVREFMEVRWADIVAEKQKMMFEANRPRDQGWLAWGSSMFNSLNSGVSQTFSDVTARGGRRETFRDTWLNQQL